MPIREHHDLVTSPVARCWPDAGPPSILSVVSTDWASAAAVVAAAFGSTGLAGLLTGGLQLTKRGRLKKSIARSQEVLSGLPRATQAHAAVLKAVEMDATRMAALTLVGFPKSTVWFLRLAYIYLVLVTGAAFVAQAVNLPLSRPEPNPTPVDPVALVEIALAIIAFVIAVAFALASVLRHRRETFVASVQSGVPVSVALRRIPEHGPASQALRYLGALTGLSGPKTQATGGVAQVVEPLRLIRLRRLRRRRRAKPQQQPKAAP